MELCTARSISNHPYCRLFTAGASPISRFQKLNPKFPASRISPSHFNPSGLRYCTNLSLRSSLSDEISTGASKYTKDGPDGVVTLEESRSVEKNVYGEKFPNEAPKEDSPEEKQVQAFEYGEKFPNEEPKEDSPEENQVLAFEFLEKLNIKFDSDDKYPILLLGGGALVAVYIATAVVGAIDSIPLVPKLMQVVGLSYTVWFGTRYLLFKKSREQLAAKIEDIKQQVLGSDDD
ncbi:uncharacterized protein [Coffea arabica]|uniref:Cyanobacterial aminoacyl-tRNA synthetase CAAD domain-containing protein n=1 Tax=Coffea arabica TaxID=13443 RepID=A0A6P6TPE6_COFAR|nr:protein CURVATURE THYLAKOID 1D, chloroplastic-like [Coffea arabica]